MSAKALSDLVSPAGHGQTPVRDELTIGEEQWGDSMPRPLRQLLLPLLIEVARSPYLVADSIGLWHVGAERFWMPRFVFQRTQITKRRIKVAIFAGIHGDEPEAVLGLVDFVRALNAHPEVAREYRLYIYPVCNPTGLVDGTRHSRSGVDLNRQFWRPENEISEPEVRLLETELRREKFDGIISLHTDDTCDGVYGFARKGSRTHQLLDDGLTVAQHVLPRCDSRVIDGFTAARAILKTCYDGVLSAPPDQRPHPWEIILETPQRAPQARQRQAFVLAMGMILARYRATSV